MAQHGGRKPKYKDNYVSPQDQADAILRANGSADLVCHTDLEHPQVFDPFVQYGERMRSVPDPQIYSPKGCDHLPQAKTKGPPCERCGKPRSKFAVRYCRSCISAKAVDRQEANIRDKWKRAEEHIEKFSWLLEFYVDYWIEFNRSVPNFADRLIGDISRWEEQIGLPFVFWKHGDLQLDPVADPRDLPKRERFTVFRNDPKPRKNVKRMQQSAWRYAA